MIEIVSTSQFRKAFKRKVRGNKKLEQRFRDRVTIFQEYPFDPRLRTHQLSEQLQDLWSFSVDYDMRVIFSLVELKKASFIDIGHSRRSLLAIIRELLKWTSKQSLANFERMRVPSSSLRRKQAS